MKNHSTPVLPVRNFVVTIRQSGYRRVEQIRAASSSSAFENAACMIDIAAPFSICIRSAR